MATLNEILEKADLNDDTAFEFGGSKFTVGDVRKLRNSLDAETKTAKQKREEAERLATEAATLLAQLQDATKNKEKKEEKVEAKAGEDWRDDPFYAPVAKEISAREAEIKAIRDDLIAVKKNFENASAVYAYERMKNQFTAAGDKIKGKTFEELAQQAIKEKHLDSFGMPTLDPIIERLTEPARREEYATQKVAEAKKEWEAEQARAAANAKPGSVSRLSVRKEGDKPPIAKLDELTSDKVQEAMANDPEFRKVMEGGEAN